MKLVVNYQIRTGHPRSVIWHSTKPLAVGYPTQYIVDYSDGRIHCHSIGKTKIPSASFELSRAVNFGDLKISFKKVEALPKVDYALVAKAHVPDIGWLTDANLDHDYKKFKKLTQRTYGAGAVIMLALWLVPMLKAWLAGPGSVESSMVSLSISPKGGAAPGEKAAPPPASFAKALNKGQSIQKAQQQAKAAATPEAQKATLKNTFASLFKTGFGMSNPSRKPASVPSGAGAQLAAVSGADAFEGGREGGVPGGQVGGVLGGTGHTVGVTGGGGKGGYGGQTEGIGIGGQGDGFLSLNIKDAIIDEGLSKEEVGKIIHSKISEIRYCYESSMIYKPDIEGKLVVDFTIGGSGVVKTSAVKESSLEDSRLNDCILRRLAKWQFPKPKSGVDVAVTYPFIFKKLRR
jgi:TonB family protein